jgi:hypothetical protein
LKVVHQPIEQLERLSSSGVLGMEEKYYSAEDMTPFYAVVGQLSIYWAKTEFLVDALVTLLYHYYGGRDVVPELPSEFSRKIKFIKACLKKPHATVQPIAKALNDELVKLDNLKQYRHDVVHGYLAKLDEKTKSMTFVTVRPTKTKTLHFLKKRKVSRPKLTKVAVEVGEIGLSLYAVASELLAPIKGIDNLKDVVR